MKRLLAIGSIAISTFCVATAMADEFTFDVGASYGRTQLDYASSEVFQDSPSLSEGTRNTVSGSDTDVLTLFGSWYFTGLSDENGPRAQAAFADRASELTGIYRREETTSFFSTLSTVPELPSGEGVFDSSDNAYALRGRFVGRSSGWFVEAGVSESQSDGIRGDVSTWSLGVGKYLLDTTALTIAAGRIDEQFLDTDVYALGFTHLGSLGQSWQWAFDLAYEYQRPDSDFSDDASNWGTSLALYPTRDFEFGLAYADNERRVLSAAGSSVEAFASWFVTPKIEVSARYRVDDFDQVFPGASGIGIDSTATAEQDGFSLSLNVRF